MTELYPPIEPYQTGYLPVSKLHTIYYEQVGNPQGKPVVFLHGGPGGGIADFYRQFFNPQQWRVVLFDQRGCGKSTPYAELRENTTWELVEDIEKLRNYLGIEKWLVFGGSWGSSLALAYSQSYSQRCTGLILRGIFTLRKKELDWFYQEGASYIFPDFWQDFLAPIPLEERNNLMFAYYQRLTSVDRTVRLQYAKAWSIWEGITSKLYPSQESQKRFGEDEFAEAFARIECHYFVNKGFFPTDNYLIDNAYKIKDIPCIIVQGRYDIVCPMITAYELHQALPNSQLIIVPDAGHSVNEEGIRKALLESIEQFLVY